MAVPHGLSSEPSVFPATSPVTTVSAQTVSVLNSRALDPGHISCAEVSNTLTGLLAKMPLALTVDSQILAAPLLAGYVGAVAWYAGAVVTHSIMLVASFCCADVACDETCQIPPPTSPV